LLSQSSRSFHLLHECRVTVANFNTASAEKFVRNFSNDFVRYLETVASHATTPLFTNA
jgi:hypothetical protein